MGGTRNRSAVTLVAPHGRIIHLSRVVPIIDGTNTDHASPPHSIGVPSHRDVPTNSVATTATMAAPKLWMLAAMRRSVWASHFCTMLPAVTASTLTNAAPTGNSVSDPTPLPVSFGASTSPTPANPTTSPSHARGCSDLPMT